MDLPTSTVFEELMKRTKMKRYLCVICGYVYDEAAGIPEDGIPAGTPFAEFPPNWTCPDCGARKEDFEELME